MANNHPEVIISAGFHGGFDFFQESYVEQMLSGLFKDQIQACHGYRGAFQ